jgi:hypothetical protein
MASTAPPVSQHDGIAEMSVDLAKSGAPHESKTVQDSHAIVLYTVPGLAIAPSHRALRQCKGQGSSHPALGYMRRWDTCARGHGWF